jgi:hypothetical protein
MPMLILGYLPIDTIPLCHSALSHLRVHQYVETKNTVPGNQGHHAVLGGLEPYAPTFLHCQLEPSSSGIALASQHPFPAQPGT